MGIKFKIKLSRDEQVALGKMMRYYPLHYIEKPEQFMIQHIGASVLKRIESHLMNTIENKPWTLSLKPGEAAMMQYIFTAWHYDGYEKNLAIRLLHEIDRYFKNIHPILKMNQNLLQ